MYLRDVIDRLPRGEDPTTLLPADWKSAQMSFPSTDTNPRPNLRDPTPPRL